MTQRKREADKQEEETVYEREKKERGRQDRETKRERDSVRQKKQVGLLWMHLLREKKRGSEEEGERVERRQRE